MENQQIGTSPKYYVDAAAMTMCGPVRDENQDAIVLYNIISQQSDSFFSVKRNCPVPFSVAVIDGMGGYEGGADAALLTAMGLSRTNLSPDKPDEIDAYCNRLSERVLQAGHVWGTPNMGSAFAMLTVDNAMLTVANIGDCRVYRYNADEDVLGLLSIDDRLVNGSGGITQSLGGAIAKLDAHSFSEPLSNKNLFLLCSDGVWGTLGDDVLQAILRDNKTAVDMVGDIRNRCNVQKASDNCSAIVVNLTERNRR